MERGSPGGRWYYVVTILSVGVLAWVPFVHAAARTARSPRGPAPWLRARAALYGALAFGVVMLAAVGPTDAEGEPVGTLGEVVSTLSATAAIAIVVTACLQFGSVRRAVYVPPPPPDPQVGRSEAAVGRALAARQRRAEARALAAGDPDLARDLGIGRPDLARDYDDGGLVDVNRASPEMLAAVLGLSTEAAESVVGERRELTHGYVSLQEVAAYTTLSEQETRALNDRGIVLPL